MVCPYQKPATELQFSRPRRVKEAALSAKAEKPDEIFLKVSMSIHVELLRYKDKAERRMITGSFSLYLANSKTSLQSFA